MERRAGQHGAGREASCAVLCQTRPMRRPTSPGRAASLRSFCWLCCGLGLGAAAQPAGASSDVSSDPSDASVNGTWPAHWPAVSDAAKVEAESPSRDDDDNGTVAAAAPPAEAALDRSGRWAVAVSIELVLESGATELLFLTAEAPDSLTPVRGGACHDMCAHGIPEFPL